MAERETIAAFIDRIVRESRIASTREREELRREMESHFAEVGDRPEALAAAMERFGLPGIVGSELGRVHRRSRVVANLVRLIVAAGASAVVAVLIQLFVSVRIDLVADRLEVSGAFSRSALFSVMVVLALVAAWELDIESLCARLEREPLRLLTVLVTFLTAMVLFHARENTLLHPGVALIASAVNVVIWSCTISILARTDRVFARVFATSRQ